MTAEGAASQPIRSAATLIVCRRGAAGGPQVLMGQRGAAAAFMASKYVFPGGAVDPGDAAGSVGAISRVSPVCAARLGRFCDADAPDPGTIVAAGLRELAEETGLTLAPRAAPLSFVFRAITPPGRSRRFDARFFLADGEALDGDAQDFTGASDELSNLHWIGLDQARALDLPFITEVVLAEVQARLNGTPDRGVPFFDNSTDRPAFRRLI
ncbi:MAG: NUDIX hydrolase [Paracoccaceae bacterium]